MKIRLTKIASSETPRVPTAKDIAQYNGFADSPTSPPIDYWVEGIIISPFVEGYCLELERYIRNGVQAYGFFTTSSIQKINWDIGEFETRNSVYKFEFVNQEPIPTRDAAQNNAFVGGFVAKE